MQATFRPKIYLRLYPSIFLQRKGKESSRESPAKTIINPTQGSLPLGKKIPLNRVSNRSAFRFLSHAFFAALRPWRIERLLPLFLNILDQFIGSLEMLFFSIESDGWDQSECFARPLHPGLRKLTTKAPVATLRRINSNDLPIFCIPSQLSIRNAKLGCQYLKSGHVRRK